MPLGLDDGLVEAFFSKMTEIWTHFSNNFSSKLQAKTVMALSRLYHDGLRTKEQLENTTLQIAVLGPPGSGKSSTINRQVLDSANGFQGPLATNRGTSHVTCGLQVLRHGDYKIVFKRVPFKVFKQQVTVLAKVYVANKCAF